MVVTFSGSSWWIIFIFLLTYTNMLYNLMLSWNAQYPLAPRELPVHQLPMSGSLFLFLGSESPPCAFLMTLFWFLGAFLPTTFLVTPWKMSNVTCSSGNHGCYWSEAYKQVLSCKDILALGRTDSKPASLFYALSYHIASKSLYLKPKYANIMVYILIKSGIFCYPWWNNC